MTVEATDSSQAQGGSDAGSNAATAAAQADTSKTPLPESYWDAKANAPKYDTLTKDLGELTTLRAENEKRATAIPKDGAYKLDVLPDTVKIPEGSKWVVDPNDPLAKSAVETFKKHGFTQDQATAVNGLWANFLLQAQAAETKARNDTMAALGTNAQQRIDAAQKFLDANQMSGLASALSSKEGVEAVESIIAKMSGLQMKGQASGTQPKPNAHLASKLGNPGTGIQLLRAGNDQKAH